MCNERGVLDLTCNEHGVLDLTCNEHGVLDAAREGGLAF